MGAEPLQWRPELACRSEGLQCSLRVTFHRRGGGGGGQGKVDCSEMTTPHHACCGHLAPGQSRSYHLYTPSIEAAKAGQGLNRLKGSKVILNTFGAYIPC